VISIYINKVVELAIALLHLAVHDDAICRYILYFLVFWLGEWILIPAILVGYSWAGVFQLQWLTCIFLLPPS